jgi:hypothetical protein
MPLRATGDSGDLQAFEFDAARWAELKDTYKRLNLRMPCCQASAVPKTSTLGNFFFAHSRRGNCATAPETAEHLYCKTVIAKAAAEAGWAVKTERRGTTPEGEDWVADVFCTKGTAQVALEVQMSPQSLEETERRQARYKASGVRTAWFCGDKLHQYLIATARGLPLFGLGKVQLGEEPTVAAIGAPLSEFVVALLNKRVKWMRHTYTEPFYLAVLRRECPHCHKPAGLVFGHGRTPDELPQTFLSGAGLNAALGRVWETMTQDELASLGLCHIVRAHQANPTRVSYWNGCMHCRILVKPDRLGALVQAATQIEGPESGLEIVYFDREAADSGAWVLVSEDGEYQALSSLTE